MPPAMAMTNSYDVGCSLALSLPFNPPSHSSTHVKNSFNQLHFTYLSAALLAIDHVNKKNGSIVPYLASPEFRDCDVTISRVIVSNENNNSEVTETLLPSFLMGECHNCNTTNDHDVNIDDDLVCSRNPLAYIGSIVSDQPSFGACANDNSTENVCPYISLSDRLSNYTDLPTSNELANYSESVNIIPFVPSYRESIQPLLSYLVDVIHRDYIILLYSADDEGAKLFRDQILAANEESTWGRPSLTIESYPFDSTEQSIKSALKSAALTKFTTFVVIPSLEYNFEVFSKGVNDMHMDDIAYLWIVVDRTMGSFCQSTASIMEQVIRSDGENNVWLDGIAVYSPKFQVSESFRRTYLSMDDRMVNLTHEASPVGDESHPGYYHATYDLYPSLEDSICTSYSLAPQGIIFDSVVSVAKGYCVAKHQKCDNNSDNCSITNVDVLNVIEQELVAGASSTGSSSMTLSTDRYIWNIQREEDNNNLQFLYVTSYKMFMSVWVQIQSFIYSNGSIFPPEELRLVDVISYSVSPQIKLMVEILAGLGVLFCIICSSLLQKYHNHSIMLSHERVFYHMQCVGVSLVLLGCLVSNVDDTYEFGQSFLNLSCNFRVISRVGGYLSLLVGYLLKLRAIKSMLLSNCCKPFHTKDLLIMISMFLSLSAIGGSLVYFAPLSFKRFKTDFDEYDFPVASYGTCSTGKLDLTWVIGILISMLTLFVAIFLFSREIKEFARTRAEFTSRQEQLLGEADIVWRIIAIQVTLGIPPSFYIWTSNFPERQFSDFVRIQLLPMLQVSCNLWLISVPISLYIYGNNSIFRTSD